MDRRKVLKNLGATAVAFPFIASKANARSMHLEEWKDQFSYERIKDEKFWKKFRKEFYDVADDFINLENGYFGVQPIPVRQAYQKNIEKLNNYSSKYLRTEYGDDYKKIISGLARFSGVREDEILITRNATEAMNIIIQGLNLSQGDEVVLHKQDYPSMIEAFEMLEKQKGIQIKVIQIPILPESDEEIIKCYEDAITDKTKCILLTHMIHLTGQILPVRKIAEKFRPLGIDVIVDAAHSYAQMDFKIADLGADFVGVNLHKWFGNPLGAGMLYVKKERIQDLNPLFGDSSKKEDDIRKLGHFGTMSVPIILTIPNAQFFNEMVTLELKEGRLKYLQNYWTEEARKIPSVRVTTPSAPGRSCAIASFMVEGKETSEVIHELYQKQNIFTVIRHLEDMDVVRVTPTLYNHPGELDTLLEGIKKIAS